LITLKDDVLASHPVEVIQSSVNSSKTSKTEMLSSVYGTALPARMQIEQQLLNRIERLPGLPSSKLGLDSMTGGLDDFSFASYLNLPEEMESGPSATMHTVMEKKLGLTK
jgi:proteasome maturation protein